MRPFLALLRKETIQMARDSGTLRFALIMPVFQLILFGTIDTNVRRVPTVVFDQSRSQASRELVRDFENTSFFRVVGQEPSRAALREAIVAARASVGIEIPPDYARRRLDGGTAEVLVLIDGSDSTISGATLQAANGLALERGVEDLLAQGGARALSIGFHPLLLFNPDSRSANLLIPGLVAILLAFSGTLLSAYGIVRERERGTLEQLMVTPVPATSVVGGKLLPYLGLGFVQLVLILVLMTWVFGVPVHGSLPLLMALAMIYLAALLSLGLLISSWAKTQSEATQLAQMVLLPSIMLSGYIFPLSSLPAPLRVMAQGLPATHFIAISRGIIIRGAGIGDLWPHVVALIAIAAVIVAASARAFRKTLG